MGKLSDYTGINPLELRPNVQPEGGEVDMDFILFSGGEPVFDSLTTTKIKYEVRDGVTHYGIGQKVQMTGMKKCRGIVVDDVACRISGIPREIHIGIDSDSFVIAGNVTITPSPEGFVTLG